MRARRLYIAALATLVGAFLGDQIVNNLPHATAGSLGSTPFFLAEIVGRLLVVVAILALGWLVFRGPRARRSGVYLFVGGLIVALTPLYIASGLPLPGAVGAITWAWLTVWVASAIAVLGLGMIIWPRSQAVLVQETAEAAEPAAGAGSEARAETKSPVADDNSAPSKPG
jgi:hypothetical protein